MQHALIRKDGSVAIMRLCVQGTTVDGELAKWPSHMRAEIVEWHPVADVPPYDEHRDAWVWDGSRVVVDPARIKPPAPVLEQAPVGAVVMADPRVDSMRQDIARDTGEVAQAVITEMKRWHLTTQAAANALKTDAEVTTPELQAVREQSRAQLALLGPWQQVAAAIIAERDAEFRALVGRP